MMRNYEISLWTLQDSFITVLKASNIESKGIIQEPELELKDDGDNTFSFKVPMYIRKENFVGTDYYTSDSDFIENPIWYTLHDGNLLVNMRKIKVIFNKASAQEEVFEFIITKITEEHDGYKKFCTVDCNGLAFHELGKQGYTITLSQEDFQVEYEKWDEDTSSNKGPAPYNNINYWIEKVLANSYWDYLICMDQYIYDGVIDDNQAYINGTDEERAAINAQKEANNLRRKDKIYNKPYVSSWDINNNSLVAIEVVNSADQLEKCAFVDGSNSNRYNLLQSIAEAFQVFCKFRYLYDDNYHIIGRQVIFYNNFINEENTIDFNYGYNTNKISREMDSNDLISKMYVKSLNDSGTFFGQISIEDTDANLTLENYLLNFNYLYEIGTISKEQYDSIKDYELQIREKNLNLKIYQTDKQSAEDDLPEWEGKRDAAQSLIDEAQATIDGADEEYKVLSAEAAKGYPKNNPRQFTRIVNANNPERSYITIPKSLGKTTNFSLYSKINSDNSVVDSSEIISLTFERDPETSFITKVRFPTPYYETGQFDGAVYGVFSFQPTTAAEIVKQIWGKKQARAVKDLEECEEKVEELNQIIEEATEQIEILTKEKQEIINAFERLMGPALREGNWQPEDIYANYQINKTFALNDSILNSVLNIVNNDAVFLWDNELFRDEQKLEYYNTIDQVAPNYYPCIDLTSFLNTLSNHSEDLDKLNLVYEDMLFESTNNSPLLKNRYLQINANTGCKFGFLKDGGVIKPVLVVLGIDTLLTETVNNVDKTPFNQVTNQARLSLVSYDENSETIEEEVLVSIASLANKWIEPNNTMQLVYPRFKISFEKFLTTTPEHKIYYGSDYLQENEDYYQLYRDNYYYITLKPESFIKHLDTGSAHYSFHYTLTTAAEAIYLDAIEVMKENCYPKVTYSITPLAVDEDFVITAYDKLGQLVYINDPELKFENVQGYISELKLDLDKPQDDSYTIKNYKTKFEDIFSSIVAQTEDMKKNSQVMGMAASLFDSNGGIRAEVLNKSLAKSDFLKIAESKFITQSEVALVKSIADMASSNAYKIINGEIGLAFPSSSLINQVTLNNEAGLLIEGTTKRNPNSSDNTGTVQAGFQLNHDAMGFYKINDQGVRDYTLYYDGKGNLALSGDIYAKGGEIGGWILGDTYLYYGGTNSNNSSLDYTFVLTPRGAQYSSRVGNSEANLNWMIRAGNTFGVTTGGILYATGANLSGTITASSGTIGGWTINPEFSENDNSHWNALVYNSAGSYFKTATAGIFPDAGPQAVVMWIGGKRTESYLVGDDELAPFRVFKSGKLWCTKAEIAGWTIDSNSIYFGTKGNSNNSNDITLMSSGTFNRIINSIPRSSLKFAIGAKFGVANDGTLYAANADISGTITASSGTIGGFYITSSDNSEATSAQGGHKYVTSLYAYGHDNDYEYEVGIKGNTNQSADNNSGNLAFYVAQKPKADNWKNGSTNVFYVNHAGRLYASNAEIKGKIQATSGFIGVSSDAGWSIDSNTLRHGATNSTAVNAIALSTTGFTRSIGGTSRSNLQFAIGGNFGVNSSGNLYAAGAQITGATTINTSGSFSTTSTSINMGVQTRQEESGWFVFENTDGLTASFGLTRKPSSTSTNMFTQTIDMSKGDISLMTTLDRVTDGFDASYRGSIFNLLPYSYILTAYNNNANFAATGYSYILGDPTSIGLRAPYLYLTTNDSVTIDDSNFNGTYRIFVSNSFRGYGDASRALWIKPSGDYTTVNDHHKYCTCTIYWCVGSDVSESGGVG